MGRPGFTWAGTKTVTMKREWPDWRPPKEMLRRRPDLPRFFSGSRVPNNSQVNAGCVRKGQHCALSSQLERQRLEGKLSPRSDHDPPPRNSPESAGP